MSDKSLVDTNILMYAHDTSTGTKDERAKALVEELWRPSLSTPKGRVTSLQMI